MLLGAVVLFLLIAAPCTCDSKKVIILNALDDSSLRTIIEFAGDLQHNLWEDVTIQAFTWEDAWEKASQTTPDIESKIKNKFNLHFYSKKPLRDLSVGRSNPPTEYVSCILESFEVAIGLSGGGTVVIITFKEGTVHSPAERFADLFDKVDAAKNGADVVLLEKTRRLTSVSNWYVSPG